MDVTTSFLPYGGAGSTSIPLRSSLELFPNDHSNPLIYRRLSLDLRRPVVGEDLAVFWSYLPNRRVSDDAPPGMPCRVSRHESNALTRWALEQYFRPNARVRGEVDRLFEGAS